MPPLLQLLGVPAHIGHHCEAWKLQEQPLHTKVFPGFGPSLDRGADSWAQTCDRKVPSDQRGSASNVPPMSREELGVGS
ncbi:hypothetical protein PoB_005662500 [Plakobranchus ocellatus]|uniref:Uncharacterized protein n=1 Tax=Plakobranchus ocellatus TaxID=259542 RepID=A0AAV4CF78_9GAST|nr:hypothetical protein PoB_005662500 [Plakobranchus ocellatus]